MVINATKTRECELATETILTMPTGMLGFQAYTEFVLVECDQDAPYKLLQSMQNPSLRFIVVDPLEFFPDYDLELSDADALDLSIHDAMDARLLTTVTINNNEGYLTTNLVGPIVVNSRLHVAKQIVLQDDRYETKHLLGAIYERSSSRQRQAVAG
jgi:flagellar assembly factor FliW